MSHSKKVPGLNSQAARAILGVHILPVPAWVSPEALGLPPTVKSHAGYVNW